MHDSGKSIGWSPRRQSQVLIAASLFWLMSWLVGPAAIGHLPLSECGRDLLGVILSALFLGLPISLLYLGLRFTFRYPTYRKAHRRRYAFGATLVLVIVALFCTVILPKAYPFLTSGLHHVISKKAHPPGLPGKSKIP